MDDTKIEKEQPKPSAFNFIASDPKTTDGNEVN